MSIYLRALLLVGFIGGVMLPQASVHAQSEIQDRAAAVIAIESVDDILKDASHLVGAAGFPEIVPFITFGAGEYVQGLDRKKPAGAYVTFDGEEPIVIGFLPVKDIDDFLDVLSNAGIDVSDGDNGVSEITSPAGNFFIKEKGGWAFISDNDENFDDLPGDPSVMVKDLAKDYMISAKLFISKIPKELRATAIEAMQEGFNNAAEGGDELAEMQQKLNEAQIGNLIEMIEDSESVTFGFDVNKEKKMLLVDTMFTAKANSTLAKRFKASTGVMSRFGGFVRDKAAMTLEYAAGMLDADKAQAKKSIAILQEQAMSSLDKDESIGDNEKGDIKDAAKNVFEALNATIDSGKFDMGASLVLNDGKYDFVAGGAVADAKKVEEAVKKLVKTAGDELDGKVEVKLNDSRYKDVTFHKFLVAVDDESAAETLGDDVTIIVGVSTDSIYLGVGDDAEESIEGCIDASKMANVSGENQMKMDFKVADFLSFVSEAVGEAPPAVADMAEALEDGNDHITITTKTEGNSQRSQFIIQEGILKLIGVGAKSFGGGFGGGGGGFDDF